MVSLVVTPYLRSAERRAATRARTRVLIAVPEGVRGSGGGGCSGGSSLLS